MKISVIIKNKEQPKKKETLDEFVDDNKSIQDFNAILKETYELPNNDDEATFDDVKKLVGLVGKLSTLTTDVIKNKINKKHN